MADNNFLHTTEILEAAIPYIDARTRPTMILMLKLYDLIACFRSFRSNSLAACGFENQKFDLEALLSGIRPKCNDNERAFIDRILGFFNARRMFEMYNSYMSAMKAMQEFEGFANGDVNEASDAENVMGNFSGFDFASIFGNGNGPSFSDLQSIFGKASGSDAGNPNEDNSENFAAYNNMSSMDSDDLDTTSDINPDMDTNQTVDQADNVSEGSSSNTSDYASAFQQTAKEKDSSKGSSKETGSQSGSGSNSNKSMLEMLKAMIPPEQQSTFENLSMLFNSMSYDDNNKTDLS
ncbi:hypothetical protein I5677_14850 [Mobilitalea sibirica]|uniref:Uncharacterized protein n=1 Tax=Mobilitalea sibirica TaxID=1462919 RepID=A0A8J7HCK5_9FIRM|nr:hypothetical protein [Mobilitalea sibirica]MBH1942176.1 hypothetical protein [Mobilitalea sibirica]